MTSDGLALASLLPHKLRAALINLPVGSLKNGASGKAQPPSIGGCPETKTRCNFHIFARSYTRTRFHQARKYAAKASMILYSQHNSIFY